MASLCGGVRDVREVRERKRRTQVIESRRSGTKMAGGCRVRAQRRASVQAERAAGGSCVQRGRARRAVCP